MTAYIFPVLITCQSYKFEKKKKAVSKDAWMTCDFTSFSTAFQSYQDDERLMMKGCVQLNPVYS